MKKTIGLIVALTLGYFLFWPVSIDPQTWHAKPNLGYQGDFSVNTRLQGFDALELDGLHGPEAVIENELGDVYASTHEGWIIRWAKGQTKPERWVELGGRPLGIDFDKHGNLWVANAFKGLMRVSPQGEVSIEVDRVNDVDIRYADDVVVAPNGKVYFSDASTKFSAKDSGGTLQASFLDVMEHGKYGRVIEFDPSTQQSREIINKVSFANGVAVDPLGQFLLLVETGEYRVIKHWLTGDLAGSNEVIVDNLPGFPDNIHLGKQGRYWVGLTSPRSPVLDDLSAKPFLRKVLQRFPAFMKPKVEHYGMVIAIDENGKVLENLQDPKGDVYATTGAFEGQTHIYVSSLTAPFLARYSVKAVGL